MDCLNSLSDTGSYPTIGTLASLTSMFPPHLLTALGNAGATRPLLLIPVGALRLVPWPALTVADGCVLGETVELAVCPSITRCGPGPLRRQRPWPPDA